jgi:hypothetical protein
MTIVGPTDPETYLLKRGTTEIQLKVGFGSGPVSIKTLANKLKREKMALKKLVGLPVPDLISLKKKEIQRLLGSSFTTHLATTQPKGLPLNGRKFPVKNALKAWSSIISQLLEFKKRRIFFISLEPQFFYASKDGEEITFSDFSSSARVEKSEKYYLRDREQLNGAYIAPEQLRLSFVNERMIIYQLGLLLGALIEGKFNNSNRSTDMEKIAQKIKKESNTKMANIFYQCLNESPNRRPKDLDALLKYQVR